MAEKTAPVFVVATANDVSQLPPELLRKGRWDEMFFVDLPNQEERQEIWRIQVAQHGRDWKDYDVAQLARATEGLTGSEIEAVFVEALYRAFDEDQEPTDLIIAEVLTTSCRCPRPWRIRLRGFEVGPKDGQGLPPRRSLSAGSGSWRREHWVSAIRERKR